MHEVAADGVALHGLEHDLLGYGAVQGKFDDVVALGQMGAQSTADTSTISGSLFRP